LDGRIVAAAKVSNPPFTSTRSLRCISGLGSTRRAESGLTALRHGCRRNLVETAVRAARSEFAVRLAQRVGFPPLVVPHYVAERDPFWLGQNPPTLGADLVDLTIMVYRGAI
jgi:hypothetical protein